MKIIRRPRPFPPSDVKKDDILKATRNGVVDLSKVREAKNNRRKDRLKKTAHMRKVFDRKRSIAKQFIEVYKDYFRSKYDLRPSRYVTRKISSHESRRIVINSDIERLWIIFHYIQTRYEGDVIDYRKYLEHIFDEMMELEKLSKKAVIGYIEKKERIDDYFFNLRHRAHKANDVRRRSQAHSEYFDND